MITLTFNTLIKEAVITDNDKIIIRKFVNIPTVKVREGYYEIMQKVQAEDGEDISIPVCRLPIQNTLMFIEK